MGLEQLVLIAHVLIAIGIVALILLQQGKGADAGASFGSGASQTVFGSSGSGNFLTRSTAMLATLFFATSFALAIFAKQNAAVDVNAALPSQEVIEAQAGGAGDVPSPEAVGETDVPILDASDIPVAPAGDGDIGNTDDIPVSQ